MYHYLAFDRRILETLYVSPIFHVHLTETDGGHDFYVVRYCVICPSCYQVCFLTRPLNTAQPARCYYCKTEFLIFSDLDWNLASKLNKIKAPALYDKLVACPHLAEKAWGKPVSETIPATGDLEAAEKRDEPSKFCLVSYDEKCEKVV